MNDVFRLAWRVVLSAIAVVGYLAFGFPAVANLNVDGSILLALLGGAVVAALVVALFRSNRPS
ncbi:MAG TPA: hypothetical protein VGB53_06210 [Rubricoccaceae bacterium]|jgi:hypothetical protein